MAVFKSYVNKDFIVFECIFVIFLMIYTIIAIKVKQWITISSLGFPTETPEYFLRYPMVYILVRSIFFLFALCSMFLTHAFPWYFGLIVLLIVLICAGWLGRKRAFKNYRRTLIEMIEHAESEEEKSEYEKAMNKNDKELMDRMKLLTKYRF